MSEKTGEDKKNSTTIIAVIPTELQPLVRLVKFKFSFKTKGEAVAWILQKFSESDEGKDLMKLFDRITEGGARDDRIR